MFGGDEVGFLGGETRFDVLKRKLFATATTSGFS